MKFLLYLLRWQLSTPLLWFCTAMLSEKLGGAWPAIISNLVGGAVFFWIDRAIFARNRRR